MARIVSATHRIESLTDSAPDSYQRSALHSAIRAYAESNCYTDVIIELVHARGLEPLAMFGHLVRMDFEGDQWTFFKPPAEDLERLYGVDIHEMQPYRSLPEQISEQLAAGRTLIVELDSFHLPDTAGTSYRAEHVKSSVAIDWIDRAGETLHYFHGPSLWRLHDEDYRGVFRIGCENPELLPPYTELVRFDAGEPLASGALRARARDLMRLHLARRPDRDPFEVFGENLAREQQRLLAGNLDDYHAYAFATVRMAGSAFELLRDHAAWLLGSDEAEAACKQLQRIVDGCKTLSFRMARRRPFDPSEPLAALSEAWQRGLDELSVRAG